MMMKTIRRLNQVGPTSLAVVIPKAVIDAYQLKATDPVLVYYNSLVLVVPPQAEEKFREREELIRRILE